MEKILIRAPAELKDKLKREAVEKGITVNALILTMLWDWAEKQK